MDDREDAMIAYPLTLRQRNVLLAALRFMRGSLNKVGLSAQQKQEFEEDVSKLERLLK